MTTKEEIRTPSTASVKVHNMLQGHKWTCYISENSRLTKSNLRICFAGLIVLMLMYTSFLVHNFNHRTSNTAFISKYNVIEIAKTLSSAGSKINLRRKIWKTVIPERESLPQNVTVLEITPSAQSDKRSSHPIVNHFRYIINEENKCQAGSPFLILMIPVALNTVEARQAIRNTWGNESSVPGVHIIRIFLMGVTSEPGSELQQKVKIESMTHHDIIQQEYIDTYHNLTIKVLMGMNWVVTYCPDSAYVMKIDSDMFLNPEYLINHILKPDMPPRHEYFTGHIMSGLKPIRGKTNKWYMSPEEYPENAYPVYCSGSGYVFSRDLAEKIFNASLSIKHLSLEDVYMGVCLAALGIEPVPPPKVSDFNIVRVPFSTCNYSQIVTSHWFRPPEIISIWKQMQQKKHPC